ncbi:DinB family protein [Lignipirellula cremea]|uniref:DinB superfamily protein n=1 Tax=Lignipirellula cremea TaxID=2528010 RepID=A0A518DML9_9BACT|nr:DinB family protein [Lignipirellula cremea]QDU93072.1 DinB superfamily protein [Lignipirellula cremea]
MHVAAHLKASLELPTFVVESYLADLTDDELFLRPAEQMNHIAWQLGHLIASEHNQIEQLRPGSMPPLPDGFSAQHSKETSASESRDGFRTRDEYLRLMQEQRAGALAVLESLTDEELMAPGPEGLHYFGPTVGCIFAGQATHWMMHAGQWAVVRRGLGKPPLF